MKNKFGNWIEVIYSAGFEVQDIYEKRLLEEIHNLAEAHSPPSSRKMQKHGRHSLKSYERYFDSWPEAVKEAGYNPKRASYQHHSDIRLKARFDKLCKKWGRPPLLSEVDNISDILLLHTLADRFGNGRYINAVNLLGYDYPHQKAEYRWLEELLEPPEKNLDFNREWDDEKQDDRYYRYYGKNWEEKREVIRERDDWKCQRCGKTEKEEIDDIGQSLSVHHITPLKAFNDVDKANNPNNLITVCNACHKKLESEEESLPKFQRTVDCWRE